MGKVIVKTSQKEFAAGLTYTGCTRVKREEARLLQSRAPSGALSQYHGLVSDGSLHAHKTGMCMIELQCLVHRRGLVQECRPSPDLFVCPSNILNVFKPSLIFHHLASKSVCESARFPLA